MAAMRQEIDALNLGLANSKIPPSWTIERDHEYPLRHYKQDLEAWNACTDLLEPQRGPAAMMRIAGAARELLREIPINFLQHGSCS